MINGQPPIGAPNVNIELTKQLRSLLAAAERGQVASIMIVGSDPAGNMIKMAIAQDQHLYTIYTGLGMLQDKVSFRLTQLEMPGSPSAIQRATGMPGEA